MPPTNHVVPPPLFKSYLKGPAVRVVGGAGVVHGAWRCVLCGGVGWVSRGARGEGPKQNTRVGANRLPRWPGHRPPSRPATAGGAVPGHPLGPWARSVRPQEPPGARALIGGRALATQGEGGGGEAERPISSNGRCQAAPWPPQGAVEGGGGGLPGGQK